MFSVCQTKSDRDVRKGQRDAVSKGLPSLHHSWIQSASDLNESDALSSTTMSGSRDMPQHKTPALSQGHRQESWAQQGHSCHGPLLRAAHTQHHCSPAHLDQPVELCCPAVPVPAHAASPGFKPCSSPVPCPLLLRLPFCHARRKGKQASAAG